jgi:DNA-binding CsgD family transcriptional regulator
MQLRGVILQARKAVITQRFGTEAWTGLYRDLAIAHPGLRVPITGTSLVTLPTFLAFHDELMRRFFRDDDESHLVLGAQAARWTMREGPLRSFMERRDFAALVGALPSLWGTFFLDANSRSEAKLEGDAVRFRAVGLPEQHRYFEPFIIGYIREILEMFCANPIAATRVRSGAKGYHYLFHFASPAVSANGAGIVSERSGVAREWLPSLSDREGDVLLLIAEGKSNKEIGAVLGISAKTVQHHITRAYKKIGVSGRVGATVWLSRRRLIGT